jgi:hypothetical protein
MLIPELQKLIHRMELRPSRKTLTNKSGFVQSPNAGIGMDFKEVRNYIYGDDTRHIDWNVSSRMGELFVKEFHKENDRIINIFLDVSRSMYIDGSTNRNKIFVGFQTALFLALVSQLRGDRINIVCYSEGLEFNSGIIKLKDAIYLSFKKIKLLKPISKLSNHNFPYEYLKNKAPRKSISFIISDFFNIQNLVFTKSFSLIHDLYAIQIFDPIEIEKMDFMKLFYIKEPETGTGGFWNSNIEKDINQIQSVYSGRFLRLRTDQELGISLLEHLNR